MVNLEKKKKREFRGTVGTGSEDFQEAKPAEPNQPAFTPRPQTQTSKDKMELLRQSIPEPRAVSGLKSSPGSIERKLDMLPVMFVHPIKSFFATSPFDDDKSGGKMQAQLEQFYGQETSKQVTDVVMSTLFYGSLIYGGVAGLTGRTVSGVSKAAKGRNIAKFYDVDGFVAKHGLTKAQGAGIAKEVGRRRVSQAADILMGKTPNQIRSGLGGGWKTVVGATIGASLMSNWIASDNILSGASIQARDTREAVVFGQLSQAEGLEIMNQLEENANLAEGFVKGNVKLNPVLWPFAKSFLTNAKQAQYSIEVNRRIMMGGDTQGLFE